MTDNIQKFCNKYVEQLVDIISKSKYKEWLVIGQCLHDIDSNLFTCWIKYVKKCDQTKYENIWKSFTYKGYTLKYLRKLVKKMDPEKYKECKQKFLLNKDEPRKFQPIITESLREADAIIKELAYFKLIANLGPVIV
jgi:hypothetical protein